MGTIGGTQKSGQPESTQKSQLGDSPIAGDRTIRRSTVPTAPGAISLSREHTPIKNGLCVFPG
ncbi:MAG: hypothetical protein LH628_09095 [Microcoleus sp. CAN_BIN18]|nr:hypothetical protein [Microcoleus sp. CAN_BIN18]